MPKPSNQTCAIVTAGNEIVFRGAQTLETMMRECEEKITKFDSHINAECAQELQAVEAAQAALEKKLKRVLKTEQVVGMEHDLERSQNATKRQLTQMRRELEDMEEEIYADPSLDARAREVRASALHRAALSQIRRMQDAYPSAMRAQALSSMRTLTLAHSDAEDSRQ